MTEQQITAWLESDGYEHVVTESSGRRFYDNTRGVDEAVVLINDDDGAHLYWRGAGMHNFEDRTWLLELEQIPETPRGQRSKRYEHYLKHAA